MKNDPSPGVGFLSPEKVKNSVRSRIIDNAGKDDVGDATGVLYIFTDGIGEKMNAPCQFTHCKHGCGDPAVAVDDCAGVEVNLDAATWVGGDNAALKQV